MKKIFLILAVLILTNNLYPQEQLIFNHLTIDEYVQQAMVRWQVPGMSLAIIKDGKIVHIKGYGVRELGKPEPVDENTIFAIASNTKAFTGTALAILEAEGKLKLTDKIIDYFPDFRLNDEKFSSSVNIIDVLTHRMGFGTFQGDFFTWGTKFSRKELIEYLRYVIPVYEFRTGYGYNNTGFVIAGEIIPLVTGMGWDEFIKERFLIPLEMTRSFTKTEDLNKIDNKATPHSFNYNFKMTTLPYNKVDNLAACGGIYSSAKDVANWILMQLNEGVFNGNQVVEKSVLNKTLTPQNIIRIPVYNPKNPVSRHFLAYGLGWFMQDYRGKLMIEHSGGYDGMVSRTSFMPEINTGVVILTNNDENDIITTLLYQIYDFYLGVDFKNWDSLVYSRNITFIKDDFKQWDEKLSDTNKYLMPSFDMKELVGTYQNIPAGNASIIFSNGKYILNIEMRPNTIGYIKHYNNDTLYCETNDFVFGRFFIPVKTDVGKIISIKIKADDFIDPLYYEFFRKD
ncbi:MAG: serine hydrolase [Ignavibacteria bacterium]|nr:serine hydrolase [Ignavibacteria bacterium]